MFAATLARHSLFLAALFPVTTAALAEPAAHHHNRPHVRADATDNRQTAARQALPQRALEPFVDALPVPPTAEPAGTRAGQPHYEITMQLAPHQAHRDLPPTPIFGYDGVWPGPTFDLPVNEPISVNWRNELPQTYPDWLPVAASAHSPDDVVRTVVHHHGGITPGRSDGYPDSTWAPGEAAVYEYPNLDRDGDGAMLWYHDHAMGNTRLNVHAGLAGFFLLRNHAKEQAMNLPAGQFELPLLLQDRDFAADGHLVYDGVCRNFGVVNGTVFPYAEVEPRRYRLRILNGSNFRIMRLALSNGARMSVIGVDDGFLAQTVETGQLVLAPAERADVIVDFSNAAGEQITLRNTTSCFGPQRDDDQRQGDVELPHLMQFKVAEKTSSPDTSDIPTHPAGSAQHASLPPHGDDIDVTRDITLDDKGDFIFLMENKDFSDPVSIKPHLGDTEQWNLINLTDEAHPIHVHLISFRILERVPFRKNGVQDYIRDRDRERLRPLEHYLDTAAATPAPAQEHGPKDVALAPFGHVTRIAMDWYGFAGLYVTHCHLLDHEDDDMMRPIHVLPERGR